MITYRVHFRMTGVYEYDGLYPGDVITEVTNRLKEDAYFRGTLGKIASETEIVLTGIETKRLQQLEFDL